MVPDLITDMAGATAVWNALRRCGERSCARRRRATSRQQGARVITRRGRRVIGRVYATK